MPKARPLRVSKLDLYSDYIDGRMSEGLENCVVLQRELRARGYEGSYTILSEYVRPRRRSRQLEATVRFETDPGEQAQVDWGSFAYVDEKGKKRPGGCGVAVEVGAEGRTCPPSSRGQALVDSTSPRYGEKASYYAAVCLETGEVEWLKLEGSSNSGTSVAFLKQLKEKNPGPLKVIWDNAPAHRGETLRECLGTPGLGLQLVNLPVYSPDFNADEAISEWAREEATGNQCLGSRAAVQEKDGQFLTGLTDRKAEVRQCCRTVLQSRAETLLQNSHTDCG